MTDVLVVGEALIDIVAPVTGEVAEHVGGSPANVAIGLARLGHRTELATHLGTDERGLRISQTLAAEGVSVVAGSGTARQTSTATAHLDERGHATYDFAIDWDLPADVPLPREGHVHTGSLAATLEPGGSRVVSLVQRARAVATVSYDPNVRPSLMSSPGDVRSRIETLVALSDVVKASDEDVAWLYGGLRPAAVLRRWLAAGATLAVLTRGAEGALVALGEHLHEVRPPRVQVADTVGAGDSFMSGLLGGLVEAGLLGGPEARTRLGQASWDDVLPAVRQAIHCSAITVTRPGSDPPRRAELRDR